MRSTIVISICLIVSALANSTARSQDVIAASAKGKVYVQSTQTLVAQETVVNAASYSYYNFPLDGKVTLTGKLNVLGGIDNAVDLALVDLPNFQLLKAGQPYKRFDAGSGVVTNSGAFTFVTPSRNVYYLVLDNRSSLTKRTVNLTVERSTSEPTSQANELRVFYESRYAGLKKLFVFDDFDIHVSACGTVNAFSTPDIVMCRELIEELKNKNVLAAENFVFLHEVAHSLLNVWQYPMYDNEDAADEFATVMLILMKRSEDALQAAHWWSEQGSVAEAKAKFFIDDRHSISPQRARNIINWLNNEEALMARWLRMMMPNMTSEVLTMIATVEGAAEPQEVKLVQAAQQELARRGVASK
jgi:putative metallopeptidase DUF4344